MALNNVISAIATEASRQIRNTLSPSELAEAIAKETQYTDDSSALHEYCDANINFNDAFVKTLGREPNPTAGADCELLGAAWKQAQAAQYYGTARQVNLSTREASTVVAALKDFARENQNEPPENIAARYPNLFNSELPLTGDDVSDLCDKFIPDEERSSGIASYMIVSTEHLTEEDGAYMERAGKDPNNNRVMARDYGYFLTLQDDVRDIAKDFPGLSSSAKALLIYSHRLGCRLVEFDQDADVLDEFPTFSW